MPHVEAGFPYRESVREKTFFVGMCQSLLVSQSGLPMNMSAEFPPNDAVWVPGRARTAKEARELLEGLRSSYRRLAPQQREEVKDYMYDLAEHQRRFGSPGLTSAGPLSAGSVKG